MQQKWHKYILHSYHIFTNTPKSERRKNGFHSIHLFFSLDVAIVSCSSCRWKNLVECWIKKGNRVLCLFCMMAFFFCSLSVVWHRFTFHTFHLNHCIRFRVMLMKSTQTIWRISTVFRFHEIFSRSSYQMEVRNNNERFNDIPFQVYGTNLFFYLLLILSIVFIAFSFTHTNTEKMRGTYSFQHYYDRSGKRKPLPQIILLHLLFILPPVQCDEYNKVNVMEILKQFQKWNPLWNHSSEFIFWHCHCTSTDVISSIRRWDTTVRSLISYKQAPKTPKHYSRGMAD